MVNSILQIFKQFGSVWAKIGINQKITIILVLLGLGASISAIIYWAGRPEYGLLYSELPQKELASIVTSLKEQNIPYKIVDNGTTILAPADEIYDLRLKLASKGLPKEGSGFEIFETNNLIGMTDFQQQVNYMRAKERELGNTISALEQVEWAKVHIVTPEPSLYVEDQKPATASVLIKLYGGNSLSSTQVSGIAYLVSSSVEGLTPQNVTITDNYGNLLSGEIRDDLAEVADTNLDMKRKEEDRLAKKAQTMLEKVLGPGKAIVRVSLDMEFKQVNETRTTYQDIRVKKRETITESTEKPSPPVGGVPGTTTNLGQNAARFGTPSDRTDETTETEYFDPPETKTTTTEYPGTIKQKSVAVIVDSSFAEMKGPDGQLLQLNDLGDIVKAALQIKEAPEGNDKFRISSAPLYTPTSGSDELEKYQRRQFIITLAKSSSLGIGVIAFLIFIRSALRRMKENAQEAQKQEMLMLQEAQKALAPGQQKVALREEVISSIQNDPDTATRILRSWLNEDN